MAFGRAIHIFMLWLPTPLTYARPAIWTTHLARLFQENYRNHRDTSQVVRAEGRKNCCNLKKIWYISCVQSSCWPLKTIGCIRALIVVYLSRQFNGLAASTPLLFQPSRRFSNAFPNLSWLIEMFATMVVVSKSGRCY